MKICLVSSSFYPAIFYGGPISSTWDLSKKLGEKNIEVYVSTTNADGNKITYSIEATENGNTIGIAIHKRAIIKK